MICILSRPLLPANQSLRATVFACLFAFLASVVVAQDSAPSKQGAPAKETEPTKTTAVQTGATTKPNAATPFSQAMDLYREREILKAMAKFKEVAELGGVDAAASYAWLSRLQLVMREPDAAAASADKALQLDRELPTAQSAKGEVYYRQGKFAEAQEIFRKIVLSETPDARAYLGLAKIHWVNGNYRSASQVLDHAIKLDRQDPEIFWRWLPTLEEVQQLKELKSQLAMATNPEARQTATLKHAIQAREDQEKRPRGGCKLISPPTSTELKLEMLLRGPNRLAGYAIPVRLNDTKATLQVDTGAGGIIINTRVAQKARLQKFSDIRLGGIGDDGPSHGYSAYADEITVGDLQFKNCYVQVVEHLRVEDEDGLIGTNIFEDFLVDLDFPSKKLHLSPLAPLPDIASSELSLHSEMQVRSDLHNRMVPEEYSNFERVYLVGKDLLIPTQVNDSPPKLFLLDTGGWDNMISLALARETSNLSSADNVKVKGLGGEVKDVYRVDDLTLTFGSFRQHRQSLTAFNLKPLSDDAETEVSGILGFAMLWILDIQLDYRDHLVNFKLDPNRLH
jgi:tetratricopeptide (TPR) repeat protein